MNILKFVPGFRSGTKWKMIVASSYYILAIIVGISENLGQLLGGVIVPFCIFYLIDLIKHKKKGIEFKKALINFIIVFLIFSVGIVLTPEKEGKIVLKPSENIEVSKSEINSEIEKTQEQKKKIASNVNSENNNENKTDKNTNTNKSNNTTNKTVEVTEGKTGDDLYVYYIDVGQADSIFIDYNDYDILIDAGNNADGDLVVDYLKSLNVDDIEILVGTHNHEDHIGGLDDILAAFNVENIIDSGDKATTKTYKDYWNAVQNEGAKYQEDSDLVFNIDEGIEFKVLELGDHFKDVNNNSVVCMLDYNDIEFLFMGDLEAEVEKSNLNKFSDIEVLKLGHHGSKTSSSKEFLNVVKPEYGVISCGKGNKYGHPNATTVNKLNDYGIKSFRTDEQGTIIAVTNGNSINFSLEPVNLETVEKVKIEGGNSQSLHKNTVPVDEIKNKPETKNETKDKIVYVTKSGKKYHKDGCNSLSKSKIPISLEEAKTKGYTPCSKCNP